MNTENDLRSTVQLMEQRLSAAAERQLHKTWQADKQRWQSHFDAAQRVHSIPLQSTSLLLPGNASEQAKTSTLRPQQSLHSDSSNIISHGASNEGETFSQKRELAASTQDRGGRLPSFASSLCTGDPLQPLFSLKAVGGYTKTSGIGVSGYNPNTNKSHVSAHIECVILYVLGSSESQKLNIASSATSQRAETSSASAEDLATEPGRNILPGEIASSDCSLQVRIFENAADVSIVDRFFVQNDPQVLLRRLKNVLSSHGIALDRLAVNGQTLFSRTKSFDPHYPAPLMIA